MKRFTAGPRGFAHLAQFVLSLAALAGLSACGGGTSQIEPFAPTRIITFGDESSLIKADGKKYTINAVDSITGAIDCTANPIWVQQLARRFGLVFKECNPSQIAITSGVMYAEPEGNVARFQAQLDKHFATGGFGPKDLVTVMVGANDIVELYKQYPAQNKDSLLDEARARARLLAAQVNRIADANGRIVLATVFDQGATPYALQENIDKLDSSRTVFLSELTKEFNEEMRVSIRNDGRLIGLALADEQIKFAVKYPSSEVSKPACLNTVSVDNCTTNTLVDSSASAWLWANDKLLSPTGQELIARVALQRATTNPF
ncbi:lysophospholipase L1-like esterase [Paucibacter oligotrophus]|uniref:Lysophospholipase L1-like esterase n=1 Tax=Roseateles oligotrophus TaxID=1769250 RepID=A0A840LCX3_9BURK|nr:SGNH/GDSL hydrolase family protein [Roseateles oligotrophus]MBB4845571.1 lysophospholipase L1-like esterase [Roseateles oligotrophus]